MQSTRRVDDTPPSTHGGLSCHAEARRLQWRERAFIDNLCNPRPMVTRARQAAEYGASIAPETPARGLQARQELEEALLRRVEGSLRASLRRMTPSELMRV